METTFQVEVLTPEKTVLAADIVSLVAPGSEGFLGVLAHHAPLITALMPGVLTLTYPGQREEIYAVSGGFLEVSGNRAIVLADAVERPGEIDAERAKSAQDRASTLLKERPSLLDGDRAELALKRAINRIRTSDRY